MKRIVVTGGTSRIGHYLLQGLAGQSDCEVTAITRQPLTRLPTYCNIQWVVTDPGSPPENESCNPLASCETLLHCAPLWILPQWLEKADIRQLRRIVAFSSTSRFTKTSSGSPAERAVAETLRQAEEALFSVATHKNISLTIFRPTLIYADGQDKNVAAIASLIERFGIFPMVGRGAGLRMPVHAADLADACLRSMDHPATYNKSYNLSGGQPITYREMVERIFVGLGKSPRLVPVPQSLLRGLIRVMALMPRFRKWTPDMADRMMTDLVFDNSPAMRDFGYSPREFKPSRKDLVKSVG